MIRTLHTVLSVYCKRLGPVGEEFCERVQKNKYVASAALPGRYKSTDEPRISEFAEFMAEGEGVIFSQVIYTTQSHVKGYEHDLMFLYCLY